MSLIYTTTFHPYIGLGLAVGRDIESGGFFIVLPFIVIAFERD